MDNLILAAALILVLTLAAGAALMLFMGRNRFYRLRDYERVAVFHISGRFAGMRGPGFGFVGFNLLPPEGTPIDLRDQVNTIPRNSASPPTVRWLMCRRWWFIRLPTRDR